MSERCDVDGKTYVFRHKDIKYIFERTFSFGFAPFFLFCTVFLILIYIFPLFFNRSFHSSYRIFQLFLFCFSFVFSEQFFLLFCLEKGFYTEPLNVFCSIPFQKNKVLIPSNSLTPALSKILHSFLLFYLFSLLLLNTSL